MLKIYLVKFKYDVCYDNKIINLLSFSNYTIKDEQDPIPCPREFSVYGDVPITLFHSVFQNKKGKIAVYEGENTIRLKEWEHPDAKLVISCSYEESQCSFKQLLNLPANDVIAYLKQEGLKLSTPS